MVRTAFRARLGPLRAPRNLALLSARSPASPIFHGTRPGRREIGTARGGDQAPGVTEAARAGQKGAGGTSETPRSPACVRGTRGGERSLARVSPPCSRGPAAPFLSTGIRQDFVSFNVCGLDLTGPEVTPKLSPISSAPEECGEHADVILGGTLASWRGPDGTSDPHFKTRTTETVVPRAAQRAGVRSVPDPPSPAPPQTRCSGARRRGLGALSRRALPLCGDSC